MRYFDLSTRISLIIDIDWQCKLEQDATRVLCNKTLM